MLVWVWAATRTSVVTRSVVYVNRWQAMTSPLFDEPELLLMGLWYLRLAIGRVRYLYFKRNVCGDRQVRAAGSIPKELDRELVQRVQL